ncbi:hypothetical protein GJ496_006198, partial [Pomphorhynchus laevis]
NHDPLLMIRLITNLIRNKQRKNNEEEKIIFDKGFDKSSLLIQTMEYFRDQIQPLKMPALAIRSKTQKKFRTFRELINNEFEWRDHWGIQDDQNQIKISARNFLIFNDDLADQYVKEAGALLSDEMLNSKSINLYSYKIKLLIDIIDKQQVEEQNNQYNIDNDVFKDFSKKKNWLSSIVKDKFNSLEAIEHDVNQTLKARIEKYSNVIDVIQKQANLNEEILKMSVLLLTKQD